MSQPTWAETIYHSGVWSLQNTLCGLRLFGGLRKPKALEPKDLRVAELRVASRALYPFRPRFCGLVNDESCEGFFATPAAPEIQGCAKKGDNNFHNFSYMIVIRSLSCGFG